MNELRCEKTFQRSFFTFGNDSSIDLKIAKEPIMLMIQSVLLRNDVVFGFEDNPQ